MDLRGKVAVITGAAQGIGKTHVRALLQKGCKVCMSDIDEEKGNETCNEAQTEFGNDNVIFVKCDVTSEEEVKGLMKAAVDKFEYVDIMVNNAVVIDERKPSLCLDVNLNGVIRTMTVAMELMRQDKGGRGGTIVNMSSIAGLYVRSTAKVIYGREKLRKKEKPVFYPFNFLPTYSATKWGVIGYSKSWAAHPEVVDNGIRIICMCPAGTKTRLLNLTEEIVKGLYLYKKVEDTMVMMDPEEVSKGLIKVLEDKDNNGSILQIVTSPDSQVTMTYV